MPAPDSGDFKASLLEQIKATGRSKALWYSFEIGTATQIDARSSSGCAVCQLIRMLMGTEAATTYGATIDNDLAGFRIDYLDEKNLVYTLTRLGDLFGFVGCRDSLGYDAAREIDPTGLDFPRVRRWLSLCEELHPTICPAEKTRNSQIWGNAKLPMLFKGELDGLMRLGAVERLLDTTAPTIVIRWNLYGG